MRRYLRALRACAVQCFNANQVLGHQKPWLRAAVQEENDAWQALPKWARRLFLLVSGG